MRAKDRVHNDLLLLFLLVPDVAPAAAPHRSILKRFVNSLFIFLNSLFIFLNGLFVFLNSLFIFLNGLFVFLNSRANNLS